MYGINNKNDTSSNGNNSMNKISRNKIHVQNRVTIIEMMVLVPLIILPLVFQGVECLVIGNSRVKYSRQMPLYSLQKEEGTSSSWSRGATRSKPSKRSRIKAVLAKARRRTSSRTSAEEAPLGSFSISSEGDEMAGYISRSSEIRDNNGSVEASVIADAASIGAYTSSNGSSKSQVNNNKWSRGLEASPASPDSPPSSPVIPYPRPNSNKDQTLTNNSADKLKRVSEIDAIKRDTPPPEPLPFTLPKLTAQQHKDLLNGERVQHQNDMGREGSGFVVIDVKADPEVIWQCLLDFESYPTLIDTVRDVSMFTSTHLSQDYYHERPIDVHDSCTKLKYGIPSVTRAAFTLSKFRLNIAAIHSYRPHPQGHHMVFTLDPACTNLVLKAAKGIWHTQRNPDNKGDEYTRVWLLCEVKVSSLLPMWITYYAAKRAMPRATTWLKPTVEGRNINHEHHMSIDHDKEGH